MGTLHNGGVECNGYEKSQFSANISLYTIAYKMAIILWNANRKPYPCFRLVLFSMTLNDP